MFAGDAKTKVPMRLVAMVAVCAVLVTAGGARAGLLAYDGFADGGAAPGAGQYMTGVPSTNGKDNDSIFNQGPTLNPGFTGPSVWTGTAGEFAGVVYFRAEGGGLTYTDASANTLETTAGQVNLFRSTGGSYDKNIKRDSSNTGAAPSEMYFSALMQYQSGLWGGVRTAWGDKDSIRIGFDSSGHAEVGIGASGNVKGTSAGTFAADTTHLVVGKIVEGGGGGTQDSVTLYVDPVDLSAEGLNTATLTNVDLDDSEYVAGNASFPLASIHLSGRVNGAGSSLLYDEFRVGTDWADVVPIAGPPPPPPTELHFQEGVSPTAAYVADSTTIRSDRAGTPQDDDPDDENIIGRVGSAFMRGLFEFDLTQIEALGATVDGVQLVMTTRTGDNGQGANPLTVDIHRYPHDFVEADATWNDPAGDGSDPTAGGSLGAILTTASFDPVPQNQIITFGDTAAFRAAVEAALAGDNMLRLIAKRDVESGSGNHFVRFWDETTASLAGRPELVVTLTYPGGDIPEPATLALLGLAVAGLGGYLRKRKGFKMRDTRKLTVLLAVGLLLASAGAVQATVVSEDFSYSSGQLQNMSGGGTGWFDGTLGWGASTGGGATTSKVLVDSATNLTTTVGGYNITQTGTGLAYGRYNAFRGSNRYIDTDLSGTVWFSALMKNPVSTDRAGIEFNNHADAPYGGADYNRGNFGIGIYGQDLRVNYGGTVVGPSVATLPVGQTHLVVGKMVIGAGNDSLEVWADPADLQSLGAPDFSQADADMGGDLYLAGVFGYHQRGGADSDSGQIDALRISDGGGDANQAFLDVVGPPLPPPPVGQTLGAVADAYVQGVNDSGNNFGSSAQLRVKRSENDSNNRKAYMRFDLDDLVGFDQTDLADATLQLNFIDTGAGSNDPNKVYEFELYGLNDGDAGEGWLESGINWNNAPANDTASRFELLGNATSLGTFQLTGKGMGLLELSSPELLSFLQSSTADDFATFIITRSTAGTSQVTYVHAIGSKENGNVPGPQLILTAPPTQPGDIPEPVTLLLTGLAVAGLGGYVRRRRKLS